MQTVFITLRGPTRFLDLSLPADIAIGEFLPVLQRLCVSPAGQAQEPQSHWLLRDLDRDLSMASDRSLLDYGVVNGATLELQNITNQDTGPLFAKQQAEPEVVFYRRVRSHPQILPGGECPVPVPPQLPSGPAGMAGILPFLYPLSGVLMTGLIIASTGLAGHSSSPWEIVLEAAIVPFSVGAMFLSTYVQRRGLREKSQAEQKGYKEQLGVIEQYLQRTAEAQAKINQQLYPDPAGLLALATRREVLWERRPSDADFQRVRLGLRAVALCSPPVLREDYRANYRKDALEEARALVRTYSHLDGQPWTMPLGQAGVVSIVGDRRPATGLVRALLGEIMTFHSPNEVRIVAYFPPSAAAEWSWLKWSPHTRRLRAPGRETPGEPEMYCMLASTSNGLDQVLKNQVVPELERRERILAGQQSGVASRSVETACLPHLVILLDAFLQSGPLAQLSSLEKVMQSGAAAGMTVLYLSSPLDRELGQPGVRLTLTASFVGEYHITYKEMAPGGQEVEFIQADTLDVQACEKLARNLSPLQLIDREAEIDFSRTIRLMDFYPGSSLEQLNIQQLWQRSTERLLLRVPIGMQKDGALLLDFKEMALDGSGPHGLVVGAVGSGKSELLRTVVTSLALTHDPYTLNFVLIDFKGGAAFADFERFRLPHLAGLITNLMADRRLIDRTYASLQNELTRRQDLLARAGNLQDIRQYQEKWRRRPDQMEPLPYLLIIVDEFAQIVSADERFRDLFVKFGQLGRSLGIHMMLTTQSLRGSNVGPLDPHLRYRICLRTFSPEESRAVIGTPDAFTLPLAPGAGYFKVDDNVYTRFKTALVWLPYIPPEEISHDALDLVAEFQETGSLVPLRVPAPLEGAREHDGRMEMHVLIERLANVPAPEGGWRVHPVWHPELEEMIPLSQVLKMCVPTMLDGSRWLPQPPLGTLCVPVGMVDRPAEQKQTPLILDFSDAGGHLAIVGAPRSGKSTLLRTVLVSLLVTHTPRDIQIYGIDCGSSLLHVFEGMPHVGAICALTERDRVQRLLRRLKQLLAERETLFRQQRIESMAVYRRLRQQKTSNEQEFGDVFLVIDNFDQLQAALERDVESSATVEQLIAGGLKYGIHVVLSAPLWSSIRTALRTNIGSRLELHLNDASQSEIDPRMTVLLADIAGRGLNREKQVFQGALPLVESEEALADSFSLQRHLEELRKRMRSAWQGPSALAIVSLPAEVAWSALPEPSAGEPAGMPVGLEETQLRPFYVNMLRRDAHLLLLGEHGCGKTMLLRTLLRGLMLRSTPEQARVLLIDYRRGLSDLQGALRDRGQLRSWVTSAEQLAGVIGDLKAELEARRPRAEDEPSWSGPHYYVIVDDYDDVVIPGNNPFSPLERLIGLGQEIGLHMVLVLRKMTYALDRIWGEMKALDTPSFSMRGALYESQTRVNPFENLPTGRAFYVRGATRLLVQIASSSDL